jgi:hypothetical protein
MDNRLNEIRKKISDLRQEMRALENVVRMQIAHDMDCSEVALRLMAMRGDVVGLIRQRDALGGSEACPTIAERLAGGGSRPPGKKTGRG